MSGMSLNEPVPYRLHLDEELLRSTREKLRLARFPTEPEDLDEDDWSWGAKVKTVRRLAEYWQHGYDWREQETRINRDFNQFQVKINVPDYGEHVFHFAHHKSSAAHAIPLLFVAGWPGSFLEACKIIQPLTEPNDPKVPAFHFVVASLPGFGPGLPATKTGLNQEKTGDAFKILMVDVLGYDRFVTQGGDYGAWITRTMAHRYPQHVSACHFNFFMCRPPAFYKHPLVLGRLIMSPLLYTAREKKNLQTMQAFAKEHMGYLQIQGTKPQSLGFGLGDSPIGLLAWFVEKFHDWMDTRNYDMPDDEVITFVMMHWMHGGTPGFRYYKEAFGQKGHLGGLGTFETYCAVPTGFSDFAGEVTHPPKDWLQSYTNLVWYREHITGGHFAAVECPELLVKDMQECFNTSAVTEHLSQRL